ncbi:probable LRR receptor-like serine/threonine-protein kinase At3g47570 [Hibiscus syriacus]|uniref:probable LRR receptor-like serine/threonine-protein kinase At3g47570 n=1 Tax=Hibiscus syriacus TaxID=106335 RepID=UPI0019241B74|nr:probable LRR receptor-like serine/threonine-protein kinase At3g47570 [Hibiscus syriacus]
MSARDLRGTDIKTLQTLYNKNKYHLNLIQRLNIALDVASALDYLHSQFDRPVIHYDLKPSTVLLDADLTAHFSDFGPTRFLSETTEQSISEQSNSMGIRRTMGYIPPGSSVPY